jgi:hypothetical protein
MKRQITAIALTIGFTGLGVALPAENGTHLDYEIEDQFKAVHRSADVEGTVVVLIGSDRGGVKYNQQWGTAIYDALGDHPRYGEITHLPYANMKGVPFFLKGMIRGKFPQDPARWVLMDWKGALSKTYDFEPGSSNVLVFARDGALVHQASGQEPDDASVAELVAVLRRLLDEEN